MTALAHQPSLLDAFEPAPARVPAGRSLLRVAAPPTDDAPAVTAEHPTFEDVVVAAWEGLTSAHSAECLVCGGDVRPRYGAGPKPVAGTCRDCGTEIA